MAAIVTVVLLCAACSDVPAPAGSSGAGARTSPPAGATPQASPGDTAPPAHAGPETPGTTSGPLSIEAFPAPEQLGPGWEYRVDPGDAEAGFIGNGTPGLARDPAEVATLAVPLGCPRSRPLPAAAHAFEVDYAFRGQPVVAVRLEFTDLARAAEFHAARTANVRACLGRSGGAAVGPYVTRLRGPLNDRTPASEPWTELVLRRGTGVLLMAAPVRLGQAPFAAGDVATIRKALRG